MKRLFTIVILLVLALVGARQAVAHSLVAYVQPKPGVYKTKKVISDSITIHQKQIVRKHRNPKTRYVCRLKIKGQPLSRAYSRITCEGNTFVYSPLDNNLNCGILGRDGKPVTEPLYVALGALSYRTESGLFYYSGKYLVAYRDGKIGLLDSLGNEILGFKYHHIEAVNDTMVKALYSLGQQHYFNLRGEELDYKELPTASDARITLDNLFQRYDRSFRGMTYVWRFHENLRTELYDFDNQKYSVLPNDRRKYALYDHQGRQLTDSVYDYISPFACGLALVSKVSERGEHGDIRRVRLGVIDRLGCEVLAPTLDIDHAVKVIFEWVMPKSPIPTKSPLYDTILLLKALERKGIRPSDGYYCEIADQMNNLRVKGLRDGRWQLLDRDLRPLGARTYDEIDVFFRKRAQVRIGNKWGLIDSDGNEVLPPMFDLILRNCDDRCFDYHSFIRRDNKWGVADYWGNIVVPLVYEQMSMLTNANEICLQKEGRFYLLNADATLSEISPRIGSFVLAEPWSSDLMYSPVSQKYYKRKD